MRYQRLVFSVLVLATAFSSDCALAARGSTYAAARCSDSGGGKSVFYCVKNAVLKPEECHNHSPIWLPHIGKDLPGYTYVNTCSKSTVVHWAGTSCNEPINTSGSTCNFCTSKTDPNCN